ncbi:hypothetical protein MHU86_21385 [Fragilaria crotonensis]|nr:hypothetical protein MHU86_21385 [Fragilaria crotonensis]
MILLFSFRSRATGFSSLRKLVCIVAVQLISLWSAHAIHEVDLHATAHQRHLLICPDPVQVYMKATWTVNYFYDGQCSDSEIDTIGSFLEKRCWTYSSADPSIEMLDILPVGPVCTIPVPNKNLRRRLGRTGFIYNLGTACRLCLPDNNNARRWLSDFVANSPVSAPLIDVEPPQSNFISFPPPVAVNAPVAQSSQQFLDAPPFELESSSSQPPVTASSELFAPPTSAQGPVAALFDSASSQAPVTASSESFAAPTSSQGPVAAPFDSASSQAPVTASSESFEAPSTQGPVAALFDSASSQAPVTASSESFPAPTSTQGPVAVPFESVSSQAPVTASSESFAAPTLTHVPVASLFDAASPRPPVTENSEPFAAPTSTQAPAAPQDLGSTKSDQSQTPVASDVGSSEPPTPLPPTVVEVLQNDIAVYLTYYLQKAYQNDIDSCLYGKFPSISVTLVETTLDAALDLCLV